MDHTTGVYQKKHHNFQKTFPQGGIRRIKNKCPVVLACVVFRSPFRVHPMP